MRILPYDNKYFNLKSVDLLVGNANAYMNGNLTIRAELDSLYSSKESSEEFISLQNFTLHGEFLIFIYLPKMITTHAVATDGQFALLVRLNTPQFDFLSVFHAYINANPRPKCPVMLSRIVGYKIPHVTSLTAFSVHTPVLVFFDKIIDCVDGNKHEFNDDKVCIRCRSKVKIEYDRYVQELSSWVTKLTYIRM